jgi:DNA invertase Pin-like site-specific DNA recombinase
MKRVALYARYSSDNQREASITDQLRELRRYAERQGWLVVGEYTDSIEKGSSWYRPGLQRLLRDAPAHQFDIVLAESLDRLSRDQEDTPKLFKHLAFAEVSIVTLSEGDVTQLHVGFKGTMNAMFLKDLADKTRRGLRGRVEAGKSAGGLSYGYRVARSEKGEFEIVEAEQAIVVRIFRQYVSGTSPKAIAQQLNRERVRGPRGGVWNPSTICGNWRRGTGILNNELYIGRLVWNRLRYILDPVPENGCRA